MGDLAQVDAIISGLATLDIMTMFATNSIGLFVFALVFAVAWWRQKEAVYWLSWAAANTILGLSLLLYMLAPANGHEAQFLPNCLLVAGFSLRWNAASLFHGFSPSITPLVLPVGLAAMLFVIPGEAAPAFVYGGINVILTVQGFCVALVFFRGRDEGLPSSWGLIAAYVLLAISFGVRALQGWGFDSDVHSFLPHDAILKVHLLLATVHICASGAFALSIAYERGASNLREAAFRDPLTQLHNRRAFQVEIEKVILANANDPIALAIFDIDHFKRVNDEFGHAAGDEALCLFSQVLQENLRPGDFSARVGGEEFVALMPSTSDLDAVVVAERIRETLEARVINCGGQELRLTVSVGVSRVEAKVRPLDDVMRRADRSLYLAKERGRNRVELAA